MPLLMFCGYPSSGKSTLCEQLCTYLQNHRNVEIVVVSENEIAHQKNEIFADSQKEKELRATLKSKVNQFLTKDSVVILDAMNYIKGYRYELNCISKYAQTTQCVVHVATPVEICRARNAQRSHEEKYFENIFDALVQRFECPDFRNRWDSPLYTVNIGDDFPFTDVCDSLFHGKKPKPNNSTQNPPLMDAQFLFEVDKKTQEITSAILSAQKSHLIGDVIAIPNCDVKYVYSKKLSLPELRRCRQQFISFVKANATVQLENVSRTFVMFLSKSIQ